MNLLPDDGRKLGQGRLRRLCILGQRDSGCRLGCLVIQDTTRAVDAEQQVGNGVEHRLDARFAVPQCVFGAFLFGNLKLQAPVLPIQFASAQSRKPTMQRTTSVTAPVVRCQ